MFQNHKRGYMFYFITGKVLSVVVNEHALERDGGPKKGNWSD